MKEIKRYLLIMLPVLCFLLPPGLSAEEEMPKSVYRYLEKGGELRMKTMRILQEYAMVGMHNTYRDPSRALKEEMRTLDKGLAELEELASASPEELGLREIRHARQALVQAQKTLAQPPAKEQALTFWKAMDAIRTQLNRVLARLSMEIYPDDDAVQGIMYANRLATIAQRFGALYLYRVWGIEGLKTREQLDFLNRFFPDAVAQVEESAEELPDSKQRSVKHELDQVRKNLGFFYIMGKTSRHFIPTLIYQKSDTIAQGAQRIAELFIPGE